MSSGCFNSPRPPAPPGTWSLVDATTGRLIVTSLCLADGFWSRLVGLQFRTALPPSHGLLLVPCSSVHTCWMRFPLELVMLDRNGRVLAVRDEVRPWRGVVAPRGTRAVLEVNARSSGLRGGELVELRGAGGAAMQTSEVPQSVMFLHLDRARAAKVRESEVGCTYKGAPQ